MTERAFLRAWMKRIRGEMTAEKRTQDTFGSWKPDAGMVTDLAKERKAETLAVVGAASKSPTDLSFGSLLCHVQPYHCSSLFFPHPDRTPKNYCWVLETVFQVKLR